MKLEQKCSFFEIRIPGLLLTKTYTFLKAKHGNKNRIIITAAAEPREAEVTQQSPSRSLAASPQANTGRSR